ncbi:hypothetical protein GCM10007276_17430 [Agaricicola taiwanensis]|uniref:NAD(P)-dependent oxidoreductase n=1 Tax=Agaricicola taiwanensis TaxID=591372 RepID=A0A8J2YH45_9RHOB|nr:NAD(P)-binding domain-containing protein [Agaricicola taiwanensis]GGE40583.1 hypothetical protein GCM10007276_17430 [Agaricicola taiwanensis]
MLAVMGCGEVGLLYARALRQAGQAITLCDPKPREEVKLWAAREGIALHPSSGSWLADADVVVSCVVGSLSLAVARRGFRDMRSDTLFIDMTTSDPDEIRAAAAEAAAADILYADVAIMGAVALSGARTHLLVAGTGAPAATRLFGAIDAPIRAITAGAGDAAALKLLRSVFTKGLEALAIETFLAAERQNVTDALYDVLGDIDRNPLRNTLEVLIRTHVIHAARRLNEVEEAERQLRKAGLPADVLPGVRARFERTSASLARRPSIDRIPSIGEAFAWLDEDARASSGAMVS